MVATFKPDGQPGRKERNDMLVSGANPQASVLLQQEILARDFCCAATIEEVPERKSVPGKNRKWGFFRKGRENRP